MRDIVSPLSGFGSPFGLRRRGPSFLLDQFPGAAAAYSLRALSADTTEAVRVRRSSDNTEADFTPAQIGDGSLLAWVGTGGSDNGFVTTWYDQSANTRNAVQTTAASQPKIVDAGALVTDGGKPALRFDGADDYLDYIETAPLANGPITTFSVYNAIGESSPLDMTNSNSIGSGQGYRIDYFSDQYRVGTQAGFTNFKSEFLGQIVQTGIANATGIYQYINGSLASSALGDYTPIFTAVPRIRIGDVNNIGARPLSGTLQENIVYEADKSADRPSINTLISDYYGVSA